MTHLSKWTLLQPSGGIASRAKGTVKVACSKRKHTMKADLDCFYRLSVILSSKYIIFQCYLFTGNDCITGGGRGDTGP